MYIQEPHFSALGLSFHSTAILTMLFRWTLRNQGFPLNNELYRWTKDEFSADCTTCGRRSVQKGTKEDYREGTVGAHDGSNRNIEGKEKDITQADIKVVNEEEGEVRITNNEGTSRMKFAIEPHLKNLANFLFSPSTPLMMDYYGNLR